MIRSLLLVCATLLLAVVSIYALTSRAPRADFTYVNPSGIHTLDPARMSWTQDFRVALNLWEGLTSWHPQTTKPIEGAALFPPEVSTDRLTYTFTLRRDARWSNGDPVTARDFVHGWRRGMEPGTATDYTFLFADHITGAADYVRWRREAVSVLTPLARLRDGSRVNAEQARTLAQHSILKSLPVGADGVLTEPARRDDEPAWQTLADRLSSTDVNWNAVYDQFFDAHVAELDARFREVGIRATGDRVLVVRLTQPCPFLPDLTAFPIFLPCHESIELLRVRYRNAPITAQGLVVYDPQWTKPDYHRNGYPGLITNGAYSLDQWTFKRRARLTVNPYYRNAETIGCRTVDMLVYDDVSAAIMAYEAGDVDFLTDMRVPYDHEIARLSSSGERPDFHLCMVMATYFFNFNCLSETVWDRPNPFTDPRVRKAFSLVVDKETIVANVLKRGDRVARSFVPFGTIPGYEPPNGLSKNADEARRFLADAGYPGGAGLGPVELLYTPNDERVCQAVARMWERELGVRVELRCKESKTFAEDKAEHRYMIARGNWYADYNDPTTFLDCLTTGNGNNDSGYSNGRYDALLARARAEYDPARRAALLKQAEAIIVEEDFPILPILHYAEPIAIKPYVKGLYPNARLWFPFRYVTVER
jgi:ABC-type oligopeptide transport system substrate-binding subunit